MSDQMSELEDDSDPKAKSQEQVDELDDVLADLVIDTSGETLSDSDITEAFGEGDETPSITPSEGSDRLLDCQNEQSERLPNGQNQAAANLPDRQNKGGSFDSSVNGDRYVSRFRDGQFMQQLRAYSLLLPAAPAGHTLSVITPNHSPSTPSSSTTPSVTSSIEAFFNHTSPYIPWWETNAGAALPAPARQYRTPAPCRDTSDYLAVSYRHLALQSFGPVHSLTLNLSPETEAKARAQAYPLGWIQKRIADRLNKALGRKVEFHLVLEEAEGHRLHVHGEMQVSVDEAKDARAALRKAGGKWEDEATQYQAQAKPDPDRGWLDYILLDLWRVSFTREVLPRYTNPSGKLPNYAITFAGSPTASTVALNAAGGALYEQHRQAVMASRLRNGAPVR